MLKVKSTNIVKGKIVATLGPATNSREKLEQLRVAGVDVFRLNFSHASKEANEMRDLFHQIREVTPELAVMCDIQGPKIRVGEMEVDVVLQKGETFDLYTKSLKGDKTRASINHKSFLQDINVGSEVFINDGVVRLEVREIHQDEGFARTKVMAGGPVYTHKGVNIPAGKLSTANPTEKDRRDLKVIHALKPEFVSASFIQDASEVHTIREILDGLGENMIKIISKIERPVALENLDGIIEASDGIMVARGDLGVEIPAEDVPLRQKEIIKKCARAGKPVIVATQMLVSMVNQPVPTRAEVNDVFNAILDGTDAVMLSEETAIGKYPIEAAEYMDRIIRKAENNLPANQVDHRTGTQFDMYEALGQAIKEISQILGQDVNSGKILVFTTSGTSPRIIAKFRPLFPILAISDVKEKVRQLQITWGVQPFYIPELKEKSYGAEEVIQHGIRRLIEYAAIDPDEYVICAISSRKTPNMAPLIGVYKAEEIVKGIDLQKASYAPDWD